MFRIKESGNPAYEKKLQEMFLCLVIKRKKCC